MVDANPARPVAPGDLDTVVAETLSATPFVDVHTHLYDSGFRGLSLWGIDDLLTYHYLEAELFRFSPVTPEHYFTLTTPQRADLVWHTLFVARTPMSEASRGVVAVLTAFGLDATTRSLAPLRDFFCDRQLASHLADVVRLAGISDIVMTNDPMDPEEAALWNAGVAPGPGFHAAMRLDRLLNDWEECRPVLARQGYGVEQGMTPRTVAEVRRFLAEWAARMNPVYFAVSLPPSFAFPLDDARTRLLTEAVLPACREFDVPMALMLGPRRQVNPRLRAAGDGVGRADLRGVERLCAAFGTIGLGVRLDREKLREFNDLYKRLGNYAYDQDPARPGSTPLVPNDRWADPDDDRPVRIPS